MKALLPLKILPQPDETTCGPTCLYTIYSFYYDDGIPLGQLIREVPKLTDGGTLGVWLANHALKRGYDATIYSYDLKVFDPSWFGHESFYIKNKLIQQAELKSDEKLRHVTWAYADFLDLGGVLKFENLRPGLIRKYLKKGIPVLTGLSATFLYQSKREFGKDCLYDDLRGEPTGHFVILNGYDRESRSVSVADPLHQNPLGKGNQYDINIDRVINAILLGIVTYDANLIIITPGMNT